MSARRKLRDEAPGGSLAKLQDTLEVRLANYLLEPQEPGIHNVHHHLISYSRHTFYEM